MNEGKTTCGKPSRGRYVQGCRCYMCRVANADYARKQSHQGRSKSTAMVSRPSVNRARKKVQAWLDDGYSLREICRATGVGRTAMHTLMSGKHPNAATFSDGRPKKPKRMSRANYERIMECEAICAPRPNQLVDASSLNRALAYLYAHGVTPYKVAKESGIPIGTIYHLGKRDKCNYGTLAKIAGAAERLKAEAERRGNDV